MRRHQSWYRAHVLQLPYGTGPTERSTKPYGNMLRQADAARGLNFITPQIYQAARRRVEQRAGVVEEFRLMHNMLSSQPLCFNLFAPLADLELATQLVRALPGLNARKALRVELEFTPGVRNQYLDDGTAFDAYIVYEQTDSRRAFLGVEVKLTEPFSQDKAYDSPSYRRWMTGDRSPWRPDAAEQTAKLQHNQFWRDHLLAVAHRDQPGSSFPNGRLMLVRHPEDRSCERIVIAYSKLLREGDDTLIDMPLDRLITLWRTAASTEAQRSWLTALQERYVDLEKSQQLWAASGTGR
jgi:hypothetical protein